MSQVFKKDVSSVGSNGYLLIGPSRYAARPTDFYVAGVATHVCMCVCVCLYVTGFKRARQYVIK